MGMVIVVPAFAEGEERNPPAVGREIPRGKAPRAPAVGRRIHQPCRVQAKYGAQESSDKEKRQAADGVQEDKDGNRCKIVILRNPHMKSGLGEIRNIAGKGLRILVKALARENPSHVRPPFAVVGRMWVAFLIREL